MTATNAYDNIYIAEIVLNLPETGKVTSLSGIIPPLLLLLILFGRQPATAGEYVSVAQEGVNMRAGPSLDSEIYWLAFKDYPLKVLQHEGKWIKVKDFANDSAWIFEPLTRKKKTVIVKVDAANLRFGPGINYEIIDLAGYGVVFQLLEVEAGFDGYWFKVLHQDGTEGWISEKLLWPDEYACLE